jgi:UDP-N-acetyl-D-mannosaminuronic acid dehydrogenase
MKVSIIGIGRVGLPFALYLKSKGVETIGVDTSDEIRNKIKKNIIPFKEPKLSPLLKKYSLKVYDDLINSPLTDYYIITIGTPLKKNLEPDLSNIINLLKALVLKVKKNNTIILRSTVAPGTTQFVKNFIEKNTNFKIGKNLFLSHCPERLAEGKAIEELAKFPQILGSEDSNSTKYTIKLFKKANIETVDCSYNQAELAKLFLNSSRYLYFATINFLAMKALSYNEEPHEILKIANYKYSRPIRDIPGFTAGTCLRKDFGMISEGSSGSDLLTTAWRINESLPEFLVSYFRQNISTIFNKNVVILGYTFKIDSDDVRDSLVPKLVNAIIKESPMSITISDPYLKDNDFEKGLDVIFENDYKKSLKKADICFVGTNQNLYRKNKKIIIEVIKNKNIKLIDIWNTFETNKIFFN